MKKLLPYCIIIFIGSFCGKGVVRHTNYSLPAGAGPGAAILVDASRDGGAWWTPQVYPFDATKPHQGSALVNYLKLHGYSVKELEPGASITKELLGQYRFVIRTGGDGVYASGEMEAYRFFLRNNTALLLINGPQKNYPTDQLSLFLGLQFEGSYTGKINSFNGHPITAGVSSIDYVSGSVILKPDSTVVTPLAYFNNGSVQHATAMGTLNYPGCRIVFLGDINALEFLPQPLTDNLVRWLF